MIDGSALVVAVVDTIERGRRARDDVSFYDGLYVALAESVHLPLVTSDVELAGSHGPRCAFELV